MAEDLYTVGLALQTDQLQQGVQQATRGMQTLGQAEDRLTAQTKQTEAATQALGKAETTLGQVITRTEQATQQQTEALRRTTAAEREATQATHVYRDALGRLRDEKGRCVGEGGRATETLTKQGSVFGGLRQGLTQLQGLYTTMGAYVGGQFVRAFYQAGVQMDGLQRSFKAITGSAAGARQELAFVTETANRLGLDVTTLAESYRSFAAASRGTALEGQQSREVFTAISEASTVLGLSTEQTGRALIALQQIMSKGTVSAEELRGQLGEALPGAFQVAARAMGVTTQRLDEMLASGHVLATDFLPKFAAQVRKELGQGVEDASKRAGAGVTRLWNVIKAGTAAVATQSGVLTFFDTVADKAATTVQRLLNLQSGLDAARAQLARQAQLTEQEAARIPEAMLRQQQALQRQVDQARSPQAQLPSTAGLAQRAAQAVFGERTTEQIRAEADARVRQLEAIRRERGLAESARGEIAGPGAGFKPGEMDPVLKKHQELTAANKAWQQSLTDSQQVLQTAGIAPLKQWQAELAANRKRQQELQETLAQQPSLMQTNRDATLGELQSLIAREHALQRQIDAEQERAQQAAQAERERQSRAEREKKDAEARFKAGQTLIAQQEAEMAAYAKGEAALRRFTLAQQGINQAHIETIIANDKRLKQLETARQARESQTDRIQETVTGLQEEIMALILSEQEMEKRTKTLGIMDEAERQNIRNLVDAKYALEERARAEREAAEAEKHALKDRIQAMHEAASLIEEDVRGPDPEQRPQRLRKDFDLLDEATSTFADHFIDEVQRATETGKFSFKSFADSAIADLSRILQQQVLGPQLDKLLTLGLQAVGNIASSLFGGGPGVGATLSAATIAAGGGTPGLATGGPLRAGLTLVGEAGPEVIASRGGRSMVFPTSHPLTRAALRSAGVPRRQYGGPLPSAVMGATGSAPEQGEMTMTSGRPGAGVVQNFYIQTPDAQSFMKSKGEVQRQMMNAFRASQRS